MSYYIKKKKNPRFKILKKLYEYEGKVFGRIARDAIKRLDSKPFEEGKKTLSLKSVILLVR